VYFTKEVNSVLMELLSLEDALKDSELLRSLEGGVVQEVSEALRLFQ
jgi:hypothetical protein